MKHRASRRAKWSVTSGKLSVGLATFGLACMAMAIVSPDSVPRADATAASQESVPRADATTTPDVSVSATATKSSTPGTSGTRAPALRIPSSQPSPPEVAVPVGIRIPAIGLSARVDEMGLQKDRTVQVPDDPWRTGWYGLGPRPGQPGSAVVLGHVDSRAGAAVFGRLDELRAGDRVIVETVKGTFATFEVLRLKTYPNAEFPAEKVYAAPGGERLLNLITCAGEYNRDTGRPANLVVFTKLVRAA